MSPDEVRAVRAAEVARHTAWQRAHPERVRESQRKWREGNREKTRAYSKVRRAIRSGRLVKGPCERESAACYGRVEAHHEDYSKPLDVRWLCQRHHGVTRRT